VILDCHPVGDALLLRVGAPGPEQTAFAASLAADPDHTVVICDLAQEHAEHAWEPVLQALAATAGSLRLVPWRRYPGGLLQIGEMLGRRLARVVVAADGHPVMSTGGGLFVPPAAGTGWYRAGPGRLPRLDSRRFPKPQWTAWAPLEDVVALSPATTLRPLPSGAWLSPQDTAPGRGSRGGREHSLWLYRNTAWSHDTINVVLGQPGAPPVPAADVAKLWATLPVKARQRVQFVPYGTSGPSRQELADALGDRVTVAAPLPGVIRFASELADIARGKQDAATPPAAPRPADISGAEGAGAVSQPSLPPARAERQRPPSIRLESGSPGGSHRPRAAASLAGPTGDAPTPPRAAVEHREKPATVRDEEKDEEKQERPSDRAAAPIVARGPGAGAGYAPARDLAPTSFPAPVPPPVFEPSAADGPAPAVTWGGFEPTAIAPGDVAPGDAAPPGAATAAGAVRVQPVPAQEASAAYLDDGLEQERQWLQRSLSRQFSATASSVASVLSRSPRLRGGGGQEVVADLVAVRLYLTEHGQRIDDNVRTGQPGSHVSFARCVNAGLRRLPSHRGAAWLCATLSDGEWSWYGSQRGSQRLVTEWAFCPALTDGTIPLPGNVQFLIWSATARRASALAPEGPGQVVFLPGTRFKVLEVRDGERRAVLLREVPAAETAPGAPPGPGQSPLDEIALNGLEKASAAWKSAKPGAELPPERSRRFGHPPGLLRGPAGGPDP
jgi:hypothetical protein